MMLLHERQERVLATKLLKGAGLYEGSQGTPSVVKGKGATKSILAVGWMRSSALKALTSASSAAVLMDGLRDAVQCCMRAREARQHRSKSTATGEQGGILDPVDLSGHCWLSAQHWLSSLHSQRLVLEPATQTNPLAVGS